MLAGLCGLPFRWWRSVADASAKVDPRPAPHDRDLRHGMGCHVPAQTEHIEQHERSDLLRCSRRHKYKCRFCRQSLRVAHITVSWSCSNTASMECRSGHGP
jgi:hypothetical protein